MTAEIMTEYEKYDQGQVTLKFFKEISNAKR